MLGNTLIFSVVLVTFYSLVIKVATDDNIEVDITVDGKDEQDLLGELPDPNVKVDDKNVNSDNDKNKPENQLPVTKDNKENIESTQKDTLEILEEFKETKDKREPLWKIKDRPDKRQEPGFDLTPDEQKKFKIWKGGVIPYYIDVVSFSDKVLRDIIRNFLQMVNAATAVKFMELPGPPTDDNERWVFFVNRRSLLGCADHTVKNFTNQGVQQVVLGYDCIHTRGELAEAVMSIVGVPAQHNAPDRDKFVQVNMDNILPEKRYLFEKLNDDQWLFHDLNYDFSSITHYDVFKYSANGRPTIEPKDEAIDLGLTKEFSSNDLLKIKMLYNYVVKTMKLHPPECEKLFEPANNFERFLPNAGKIKPRTKPSRYLGSLNQNLNMGIQDTETNSEEMRSNENILSLHQQNRIVVPEALYDISWEPMKPMSKKYKVKKNEALAVLSDYHSE